MKQVTSLKVHVLVWSIFILYELLVSYTFSGKLSNPFDYIGHYALNIGLFYFNALVTFEVSFKKRKAFFALLLFLLLFELSLYICLKYLLYRVLFYFNIYTSQEIQFTKLFLTESIWRAVYFIGLSAGYWFFVSRVKQLNEILEYEKLSIANILEKKGLEKNLLEKENSFLKVQINPHFLFNALGLVHNSVINNSPNAADTVLILSDILRYALEKPQDDGKVFLIDEIEHINNYILINQYRYNNALNLTFNYEGDIDRVKIPPLLLITIVENIFKYGDLKDANFPATIRITVNENDLVFISENKKNNSKKETSSRIGMSNVMKRLELQYKDRYKIKIVDSEKHYLLTLMMNI